MQFLVLRGLIVIQDVLGAFREFPKNLMIYTIWIESQLIK